MAYFALSAVVELPHPIAKRTVGGAMKLCEGVDGRIRRLYNPEDDFFRDGNVEKKLRTIEYALG